MGERKWCALLAALRPPAAQLLAEVEEAACLPCAPRRPASPLPCALQECPGRHDGGPGLAAAGSGDRAGPGAAREAPMTSCVRPYRHAARAALFEFKACTRAGRAASRSSCAATRPGEWPLGQARTCCLGTCPSPGWSSGQQAALGPVLPVHTPSRGGSVPGGRVSPRP